VSWAWWDWPLTWLTNHRPSVLWRCWLGYVTRKIVFEMTYNVSSGTLNSTIPYHSQILQSKIAKSTLVYSHLPRCHFAKMVSTELWGYHMRQCHYNLNIYNNNSNNNNMLKKYDDSLSSFELSIRYRNVADGRAVRICTLWGKKLHLLFLQ